MASLDIFNNDAFSLTGLTASIAKAPYKPRLLGKLGLFQHNPIYITTAYIETKEGKLSLVKSAPRGTQRDVRSTDKRKVFEFTVPHFPEYQTVMSSDIQGLRAFGTESELEVVGRYVNDQLTGMRDNLEATHEWLRIGALKGVVYDGDGTTELVDFYDKFDITRRTEDFDASADDVYPLCAGVIRQIAASLGNTPFGQIWAICGDQYFDSLRTHTSVKATYQNWDAARFLQQMQLGPEYYSVAANGFMFGNIMFVNYRGAVGSVDFIEPTEAYYVPTDVSGMFLETVAPADFMETVNTRGQLIYVKQKMLDYNKGIELHAQTNVLYMNTRPGAVIKSTVSNYEG